MRIRQISVNKFQFSKTQKSHYKRLHAINLGNYPLKNKKY